jgi:ABC-type nitrate/sulfonate/bicarbonate transport system permease component
VCEEGVALLRTKLAGFLLVVLLLIAWELAARSSMLATVGFPPFSRVAEALWSLTASGKIAGLLLPSLERLVIGYGIAVAAGVTAGIAMGYFRVIYNLLEPLTEMLRPIPSPAYIPIAILFLGLGNEMKIFAIAFTSFFPILLNAYSGVQSVDVIQINTARTFGFSSAATLVKVIIPSAFPQICTGMRVSLAIALIMVVISEMVASVDGIGFFILNSQRGFRIPDMYAGVIVLGVLGYALNALFVRVERYALRWHYDAHHREHA